MKYEKGDRIRVLKSGYSFSEKGPVGATVMEADGHCLKVKFDNDPERDLWSLDAASDRNKIEPLGLDGVTSGEIKELHWDEEVESPFDQGGLKRMPDGTLESVHIPEEEEVFRIPDPKKPPYTATGTGGPVPKPAPADYKWTLEEKRYQIEVELRNSEGTLLRWDWVNKRGIFRKRSKEKMRKLIAEAKEKILSSYLRKRAEELEYESLCREESGDV